MLTSSAHPDTIDQVQFEIQKWLGSGAKWHKLPLTFSRVGKKTTLRVFVSHPSSVKLETQDCWIFLQMKERRLTLNLDKFVIRAAYEGKTLRLDIDHDAALEHPALTATLRQLAETKHPVFYTRLLRAAKSLEGDLTEARIGEATAAPTDHLVMLDAVSAAPWVTELAAEDPVAAAKFRGVERRRQMLEAAGGALSATQASEVLGISRQAVDKRRAAYQLLALTRGKRGYSYPSFQFEEGKTLRGLEEVLPELRALDPWMQLKFFTSPHERLGGKTAIKALQNGSQEEVKKLAGTYGEQGAL